MAAPNGTITNGTKPEAEVKPCHWRSLELQMQCSCQFCRFTTVRFRTLVNHGYTDLSSLRTLSSRWIALNLGDLWIPNLTKLCLEHSTAIPFPGTQHLESLTKFGGPYWLRDVGTLDWESCGNLRELNSSSLLGLQLSSLPFVLNLSSIILDCPITEQSMRRLGECFTTARPLERLGLTECRFMDVYNHLNRAPQLYTRQLMISSRHFARLPDTLTWACNEYGQERWDIDMSDRMGAIWLLGAMEKRSIIVTAMDAQIEAILADAKGTKKFLGDL